MNRLPCPACKTIIQFPDDLAGRALPCPKCKKVLRIGLAASSRPGTPAPANTTAPANKIVRLQSRPQRGGGSRRLLAVVAGVVLVMAAGGAGVFYLAGGREPEATRKSPPTQQAAVLSKGATPPTTPAIPVALSQPQEAAPPPSTPPTPAQKELPAPPQKATPPQETAPVIHETPAAPVQKEPAPAPPAKEPAPAVVLVPANPTPARAPVTTPVEPPAAEVIDKPEPAPKVEVEPPGKDAASLEAQVLARLNTLRVRAGVITVRLDRDLCRGCRDHAGYLVRNAILQRKDGASPYWEDSKLPGFTELGARTARAAWIDDKGPLAAVERWAASPLVRGWLLNPRLQVIGLGLARGTSKAGWVSVFQFPTDRIKPAAGAVLYPADQQADVPLAFPGNEVPDPLPDTKDKVAGYPITVTFPAKTRIDKPTFDLEDERGEPVKAWFSWPAHPANKQYVAHQGTTICLIAHKTFQPGSRYTVRITAQVGGKRWSSTWSFVTRGHDEGRQEIQARALARINAYRKAAGLAAVKLDRALTRPCAAHASYMARNGKRGMNLADEDPNLPGYSEEGQRCSKQAIIRPLGGPEDAVDGAMASLFNRFFVLDPALTKVGIGFAPRPGYGYYWAFHLRPKGPPVARRRAVLFPGEDQRAIPLAYPKGESPNPVPSQDKTAGFAITAILPAAPVTAVKGRLTDKEGKEIECWLHTPEQPLLKGGSNGLIALLPRQALAADGTYKVSMTAQVNGRPWKHQWTFHTVPKIEARQQDMTVRMLARVNEVRKTAGLAPVKLDEKLSHACLLHARYLLSNHGHPALEGLGVHNEDPKLPNATPEGAKAGKASVIAWSCDPLASVDDWVSTFYHRIPLLSPELKQIGFAALPRDGDNNWYSVLDSGSGK